jgi:hypothetical protein
MRPHAFTALMLCNFRFPSFFQRAHSDFSELRVSIQPFNAPRCNLVLCGKYRRIALQCPTAATHRPTRVNVQSVLESEPSDATLRLGVSPEVIWINFESFRPPVGTDAIEQLHGTGSHMHIAIVAEKKPCIECGRLDPTIILAQPEALGPLTVCDKRVSICDRHCVGHTKVA